MTLTTHAVVGGFLGALTGNPYYSFTIGVMSHFGLDSIPHWDYSLFSKKEADDPLNEDLVLGNSFIKDLFRIGADFLLGMFLVTLMAFLLPEISTKLFFLGAIGAVLPDFLQFVYFKMRRGPMRILQTFHIWIHAPKHTELDFQPGFYYQLVIVLVTICLVCVLSLY